MSTYIIVVETVDGMAIHTVESENATSATVDAVKRFQLDVTEILAVIKK